MGSWSVLDDDMKFQSSLQGPVNKLGLLGVLTLPCIFEYGFQIRPTHGLNCQMPPKKNGG